MVELKQLFLVLIIIINFNSFVISQSTEQTFSKAYNVIQVKDSNSSKLQPFCVVQFDNENVTEVIDGFHTLKDLYEYDYCEDPIQNLTGQIALIHYTEDKCDLNWQVERFIKANALGLLLVASCNENLTAIHLMSNFSTNFTVAITSLDSFHEIRDKTNVSVRFKPIELTDRKFDGSLVLMWLLSTGTVVVGTFWSGKVRFDLWQQEKKEQKEKRKVEEEDEKPEEKSREIKEEPVLKISPLYVMFLVVGMTGTLLAMYFFYKYLFYILVGLFTLAAISSTFMCTTTLLDLIIPQRIKSLSLQLTCCSKKCDPMPYYQLIVLLLTIGLVIYWLVIRNTSYSWWLQDLLGVCFSCYMLRTLRLPSYLICTMLLSLLFIYDIFFVFVTPLLTKSGESVMVDVATGGESKSWCGTGQHNQLPMLLRIPRLLFSNEGESTFQVCFPDQESLLGFGDILVPGLLVAYCAGFDLIFNVRWRLYYVTSCISYGLGMIATELALILMKQAQPALLYLVPFTLIPPFIIALIRKELKQLWLGPEKYFEKYKDTHQQNDSINGIEDNNLIDEDTKESTQDSSESSSSSSQSVNQNHNEQFVKNL